MSRKLNAAMPEAGGARNGATQDAARIALGLMLGAAGISHLTFAREPFRAQVPPWVPLDTDMVVVQSGMTEIVLGTALIALPGQTLSICIQAECVPAISVLGKISHREERPRSLLSSTRQGGFPHLSHGTKFRNATPVNLPFRLCS